MTTKFILINTDTHVVVPREPTAEMLNPIAFPLYPEDSNTGKIAQQRLGPDVIFPKHEIEAAYGQYVRMIEAAPQFTTPPVLRWDGCELLVGNVTLAQIGRRKDDRFYVNTIGRWAAHQETEQEARRAAEKALGFPEGLIIPEV